MNRFLLVCLSLFLFLFTQSALLAQEEVSEQRPEILVLVEQLSSESENMDTVVQYGGRLMPLSTFARIKLMSYSGRSSLRVGWDGEKLGGVASREEAKAMKGPKYKLDALSWLLLSWKSPEWARSLPIFVVDNTEVINTLGLDFEKKRDRYSAQELSKVSAKLMEQGQQFAQKKRKDKESLSTVQDMTLNLATQFGDFMRLMQVFDFARPVSAEENTAVPKVEQEEVRISKLLLGDGIEEVATSLSRRYSLNESDRATLELLAGEKRWDEVQGLLPGLEQRKGEVALWSSPLGGGASTWWSPAQTVVGSTLLASIREWSAKRLALIEDWIQSEPTASAKAWKSMAELSQSTLIGVDAAKFDREKAMNKNKPFSKALAGFVLAFLLVALGWFFRTGGKSERGLSVAGWIACLLPLLLLCWGIVERCLIRSRPPVSNLYETILFITAVVVALALIIEWMGKKRMALAVAPLLGALGLFLANRYELEQAADTMEPLRAVLDTNFWLATHVIIINIGYAGGILAAAISHVYILARFFGIGSEQSEWAKSLTRIVYGVVCFCLFFSLVGTVLGGIWGNESWGRFWGWDPKENGALLIVIWCLVILHGRLGGYLRRMGLHVASIFLGCVVIFSWFGVNNLGIGLHSYGFTSGLWRLLFTVWISQFVIMFLGLIGIIRGKA